MFLRSEKCVHFRSNNAIISVNITYKSLILLKLISNVNISKQEFAQDAKINTK